MGKGGDVDMPFGPCAEELLHHSCLKESGKDTDAKQNVNYPHIEIFESSELIKFFSHLPTIGIIILLYEFSQQISTTLSISHQPSKLLAHEKQQDQ